jgi:hypothetical protein
MLSWSGLPDVRPCAHPALVSFGDVEITVATLAGVAAAWVAIRERRESKRAMKASLRP